MSVNDLETFGNLIHHLDQPARNLVRTLEKNRRKLVQATYSGTFNYTCLNEGLLPNYSHIYIYIYIYIYFIIIKILYL